MANPFFAKLLQKHPECYPHALEAKFARILNRLADLWGSPELDLYFEDLMIDKRGGRQGFPPDVGRDIFQLYTFWETSKGEQALDPWGQEKLRRELAELGIEFTPRRFTTAVERNDLQSVIRFLDAGMSVDAVGEAGWTPLMIASFNGNEEIALLLLNRGADPRFADKAGYTPLHWAGFNGFIAATQLLLAKGAHVDATTRYGWTPLMQAAARGHAKVVGLLLNANADVNNADAEGWTALHKAVSNNHVEVARLLLTRGADPTLRHQSGVTAVSIAQQSKNPEIRALLS